MDNLRCGRQCDFINRPAYIVLFKGDDSDFQGNQSVDIVIDTELDTTGMKAHFRFMDFVQDFNSIPENKTLSLVFPNAKTSEFPLGAADATLRFEDASGKFRTVSNRIHIVVTNSVPEAYENEDSQSITVTVKGTVTWDMIEDKPTIPDPVTIDAALSKTSENPVQNKVVSKALYTGFTEWEIVKIPSGFTFVSASFNGDDSWIVFILDPDGVGDGRHISSPEDAITLTDSFLDANDFEISRHLITPTKTSQLVNDSGFLTQHQDISGKLDGAAAYEAWAEAGLYTSGTICSYNGKLYRVKASVPGTGYTPPDQSPDWELVTIESLLTAKQDALSSAQIAAANSGATAAKVAEWDGYAAQIAQKANVSDLPYAMVTPGEWEVLSNETQMQFLNCEWDTEVSMWVLSLAGAPEGYYKSGTPEDLTVSFNVWGDSVVVERPSLPGHLLDRANNLVDATTGNVTLTLPAYEEGKVRDLLVHVNLGDDGTDPYTVTVNFPSDETNTGFKVKGNASAPIPAPDAAGEWLYSFSECAPHKMAVSLAQLQDATTGGS